MATAIAIGTMKAAQVSKPGQHTPFPLGEVRRVTEITAIGRWALNTSTRKTIRDSNKWTHNWELVNVPAPV